MRVKMQEESERRPLNLSELKVIFNGEEESLCSKKWSSRVTRRSFHTVRHGHIQGKIVFETQLGLMVVIEWVSRRICFRL